MYVTQQELCQILSRVLSDEYSIDNLNNIAFYIYNSNYFKNNILYSGSVDFFKTEPWTQLTDQLREGRPVQYCIGEAAFMNLVLFVDERVLIPRPETEELVFNCINDFKDTKNELHVLDIGTGSGAIAISLANKFPHWNIDAVDVSKDALDVARLNAIRHAAKINFLELNFLTQSNLLDNKYDIIISNPPYISHQEQNILSKEVLQFEPHIALFGNENDPDVFYKVIAEFGKTHLHSNGKIYCELNEFRSGEVAEIFSSLNYQNVELRKDMQGKNRVIVVHALS
ncbi:MAG: peptide chain release factor N(5)-glutamine methyltransferase [Saprospiraceae bacterium]|nr:peptide chain release factor N(5)-glutamine methyltransferase [Saprospiraceae bacterium]